MSRRPLLEVCLHLLAMERFDEVVLAVSGKAGSQVEATAGDSAPNGYWETPGLSAMNLRSGAVWQSGKSGLAHLCM